MPKIDFLPDNKIFDVEQGDTILQTAAKNGIPHVNACGGEGKCTTCRLLILEGIENCSPETEKEISLRSKAHTTDEFRLACQTTVSGNVVVRKLVLNKEILKHSPIMISRFSDCGVITFFAALHKNYYETGCKVI